MFPWPIRLPCVQDLSNDADNFTPLTSLDWQVHVYGDTPPAILTLCKERTLPLHIFPWRPEARRAGLQRNAASRAEVERLQEGHLNAGKSVETAAKAHAAPIPMLVSLNGR